MVTSKKDLGNEKSKGSPARSPQARENQLIAMTYDLAEKQLRDGTASSQIMTQFLKMGTEREKTEREKLRLENELLKARTEAISSAEDMNKLAVEAMNVFRGYAGLE